MIIKCILVAVIVVGNIAYELWNQKKSRDDEWYLKEIYKAVKNAEIDDDIFRHKTLVFISELRTEPENTRRMLRKLAFEDMEMKLKQRLQFTHLQYTKEDEKPYNQKSRETLCNLAGRIDGLNFAIDLLNESKPKSYKPSEKNIDPSIPEKVYESYKESMRHIMDDLDKQLEVDKEWKERKGK